MCVSVSFCKIECGYYLLDFRVQSTRTIGEKETPHLPPTKFISTARGNKLPKGWGLSRGYRDWSESCTGPATTRRFGGTAAAGETGAGRETYF